MRLGEISIHKVAGQDNPADVLTKYVDRATLEKGLARMRVEVEKGRAASAAQIAQ